MTMSKTKKQSEKKISKSNLGSLSYHRLTITCACGAQFESGSTQESIHVDICSQCHPFFTGENRIVDVEGRVEKFRNKYKNISIKTSPKKK